MNKKTMILMMVLFAGLMATANDYHNPIPANEDGERYTMEQVEQAGEVHTGAVLQAQTPSNPLDVIDEIKEADDWTSLTALYTSIAAALTMLLTQIAKVVPGLSNIKGVYIAIAATVIIVVAGIINFGIGSLESIPVIWAIATLVFDKIFKDKPEQTPQPQV